MQTEFPKIREMAMRNTKLTKTMGKGNSLCQGKKVDSFNSGEETNPISDNPTTPRSEYILNLDLEKFILGKSQSAF